MSYMYWEKVCGMLYQTNATPTCAWSCALRSIVLPYMPRLRDMLYDKLNVVICTCTGGEYVVHVLGKSMRYVVPN